MNTTHQEWRDDGVRSGTDVQHRESDGVEPWRYEVKVICEENDYTAVTTCLKMCRTPIRPLYAKRCVQSVYFDTYEGRAVSENLAGLSQRAKLRFRWYGTDARGVRGRLERKMRDNSLARKQHVEINHSVDVEDAGRQAFMQCLKRHIPPEWRYYLEAGLEPVQWIRYEREYFSAFGGAVRLTVDRHMHAFDQRLRPALSCHYPTAMPRVTILECKAHQMHYTHAREIMNQLPVMADKCSKFIIASRPELAPVISRLSI